MNAKPHLVIFTDLDGTLLAEDTYEPGPALPVLEQCHKRNIPVVFCSSKTAEEMLALREKLNNSDPFVVENGGGIYIPSQMSFPSSPPGKRVGNYYFIEIGTGISALRETLKRAAKQAGVRIKGMGDMSVAEVVQFTGLPEPDARRAMKRQFDEPFIILEGSPERLAAEIERLGFEMTKGGRFYHILKGCDKGKAVEILARLYREMKGPIVTIGIGNAQNDLPLFMAVDRAFLVQNPPGTWAEMPELPPSLERIQGIGPEGWAQAISGLLVNGMRNV